MNSSVRFAFLAILACQIGASTNDRPITTQAERGRELFLTTPKGVACGTCHTLAGVGTAVGPDLRKLATAVGPRPLAMTIQMTATAYVQDVQTPEGQFPGFEKAKQGDQVEIWDLRSIPPVLRTLKSSQVTMKPTQTWKHPPSSAGFTSQELADIIGFLKWAATGSQTEIKASDVE